MITDSAAPTNKCTNLSAVLQLPRVLSSFQFVVDDVDQNLSFLDALTHSMKWVILQTFYRVGPHSGESYSKLWKWMSCWPHLDLQFHYIFCGVRLTEIRNTEVQGCIDPTASDLEWKVSFPHHSWSLKKQTVHRGSHPGQCAVYLMPWYTLTLEKHWSLRYCWALQYHVNLYVWSSFMEEVHYHHQE